MPDDANKRAIPSRALLFGRIGSLLVIATYGSVRLTTPDWWDLLDDVDLAVHEAGHIIFQPFGDIMTALGGSVFQVLVPLLFVIYFFRTQQRFGGAVVLAWVGVNLVNVARYISDARAQELPLLGGDTTIHDWWYVLINWDLLKEDVAIGRVVHSIGAMMFLLAILTGSWVIRAARARERELSA